MYGEGHGNENLRFQRPSESYHQMGSILRLPYEMCNNFTGVPKIRCRHEVYNFSIYKIIKICVCIVQLRIAQILLFLDAFILPIDIMIMLCFG